MPCGFSRGIQTLPVRSTPQPTGRYVPKLTWLQLVLAKSLTSCPLGWRILLRLQVLLAPKTLLASLSHRRTYTWVWLAQGLFRGPECNKKTWCWKTAFLELQLVANGQQISLFLPHGFTFTWLFNSHLLTHSASGLSLLCPVLSTFETIWLLPIWWKENQVTLASTFYSQSNSEVRAFFQKIPANYKTGTKPCILHITTKWHSLK